MIGSLKGSVALPRGAQVAGGGGTSNQGQVEIFSLNRSAPRLVKTVATRAAVLCLEYVREEEPSGNIICAGLQDGRSVRPALTGWKRLKCEEQSHVCCPHLASGVTHNSVQPCRFPHQPTAGSEAWPPRVLHPQQRKTQRADGGSVALTLPSVHQRDAWNLEA